MLLSLLLAATVALAGPPSAPHPNVFKDRIAKRLDLDLGHLSIELSTKLDPTIAGVACNPSLILINKETWEETYTTKKLLLVMHEIGHTLFLVHDDTVIEKNLNGVVVPIYASVMSTLYGSLTDVTGRIFIDHYFEQLAHDLKNKTSKTMMWEMFSSSIFNSTKEKCEANYGP